MLEIMAQRLTMVRSPEPTWDLSERVMITTRKRQDREQVFLDVADAARSYCQLHFTPEGARLLASELIGAADGPGE